MADHYYYTPVYVETEDGQQTRSPGSVEAWYTPAGDVDPDTGEVTPGEPIQQWGPVAAPDARCFLDETVPRFVVHTPAAQTYSDWTEVDQAQIVADYGSEVV